MTLFTSRTTRRYLHYARPLQARSKTTADAILRAHERSILLDDHAIARVDVSQLAANRPVEDFFSAAKCLSSNAHLFGVFDGHAGAACARQVSTRLFDYLAAVVLQSHTLADLPLNERLQWLFSSADYRLPSFVKEVHEANIKAFHDKTDSGAIYSNVRNAMQGSFMALDEDITQGALPDARGRVCRMSANIASSGSCAILAHVRNNALHVANTGDSAAVLCVNNQGNVMARQLSRPHSVDNPDEVHRVRSEHPNAESSTVLRGDRLLGELYPLRAFGDVRYKWPAELQKVVLHQHGVQLPTNLHTPPYLTCKPEVYYHQLTPNDKFLVIASDGLWEWLEPDTVVRLISDHSLGAQTLSAYQPPVEQTFNEILKDLERRKLGESKKPLDDNSATHVIRNALGGCTGSIEAQYRRLQETLQLPPGLARNYRDDITCIVIHFNEIYLQARCNESARSS